MVLELPAKEVFEPAHPDGGAKKHLPICLAAPNSYVEKEALMTHAKFEPRFAHKANVELIFIAKDEANEYTREAREAAEALLKRRLDAYISPEDAWNQELNRLSDLTSKCHICGADEVSYVAPFFLCKPRGTKVNWLQSAIGAAMLVGLGAGYIRTRKEYEVIELTLNLCGECERNRTKKSWFGKNLVRLGREDYYSHPFAELHGLTGFTEIAFKENFLDQ